MCLSSCTCRLTLGVRIPAFAAAMVWESIVAVSKFVSSFSERMRGFLLAWCFSVAEWPVFGRASPECSLEGVQVLAGNLCHASSNVLLICLFVTG